MKEKNGPAYMEGILAIPARIMDLVALGPGNPTSGHPSYDCLHSPGKQKGIRLLIVVELEQDPNKP